MHAGCSSNLTVLRYHDLQLIRGKNPTLRLQGKLTDAVKAMSSNGEEIMDLYQQGVANNFTKEPLH